MACGAAAPVAGGGALGSLRARAVDFYVCGGRAARARRVPRVACRRELCREIGGMHPPPSRQKNSFTISSPTHNEGPLQTHVRDEAADHAAAGRWPGRRAGVVPPRLRTPRRTARAHSSLPAACRRPPGCTRTAAARRCTACGTCQHASKPISLAKTSKSALHGRVCEERASSRPVAHLGVPLATPAVAGRRPEGRGTQRAPRGRAQHAQPLGAVLLLMPRRGDGAEGERPRRVEWPDGGADGRGRPSIPHIDGAAEETGRGRVRDT